MEIGTLANSLWEENRFWTLARSRNLYDEIAATIANKEFRQTHRLLEQAAGIPQYNFHSAADQVWSCLQEIVTDRERKGWDALQEIGDSSTKKEFLWKLVLRYRVTYLLNCRLFFDTNPFDRFLFAAASQKKLYLWNRIRVKEIEVQYLIRKSSRLHDPNYLLTVLVNGHRYPNPKLEAW